jgi:SAM-dependent methyltransferase
MNNDFEMIVWKLARIHPTIGHMLTYVKVRKHRSFEDSQFLWNIRGDRQDALLNAGQHLHSEISRLTHVQRYEFATNLVKRDDVDLVLDLASGLGYGSQVIQQYVDCVYVGMDIDAQSVHYATKYYNQSARHFSVANALNLPLKNRIFDCVISFETMEHLHSPTNFLNELRRITSPQSHIIISVPYNEKSMTISGEWNQSKDYPHVNTYTLKSFNQVLSRTFVNQTIDIYIQTPITSVSGDRNTNEPYLVNNQRQRFVKMPGEVSIPDNCPAMVAHIH